MTRNDLLNRATLWLCGVCAALVVIFVAVLLGLIAKGNL